MDRATFQHQMSAAAANARNVVALAELDVLNIACALLAAVLLPSLTYSTYRLYERQSLPDLTPLQLGVVSRRWLGENLVSLLYVLCLAVNAALAGSGWSPSLEAFGLPLWLMAVYGAAGFYACVALRVLGDYPAPPSAVPRCCAPEFRRPRYVWYKSQMRSKLRGLRLWWIAFAAAILLNLSLGVSRACFSGGAAPRPASLASLSPSGAATTPSFAGDEWRCAAPILGGPEAAATLGQAAVQGTLGATVLAVHTARGAASVARAAAAVLMPLVREHLPWLPSASDRIGAALGPWVGAPLRLDWVGGIAHIAHTLADVNSSSTDFDASPAPTGPLSSLRGVAALAAALLRASLPLSLWLCPLVMAAIALWDVAAVSAADYSGRMTPLQASWLWPGGQAGEAPWQTRPHMLTDTRGAVLHARLTGAGEHNGGPFSSPTHPMQLRHQPHGTPLKSGQSESEAAGPSAVLAPLPRPFPDSAALVAALASGLLLRTHQQPAHTHHAGPARAAADPRRPSLRISILTLGTRGDVQPYLSLGSALREAGHSVIISSTDDFREAVEAAGLEFGPTGLPKLEQSPAWVAPATRTVGDFIRSSAGSLDTNYPAFARGFAAASRGADVVVGTSMTLTYALNISHALGLPVWVAKLSPDIPSRAWFCPSQPLSRWGLLNLARCYAYWIDVALAAQSIGVEAHEGAARVSLGLPRAPAALARLEEMGHTPSLLGFSSALFPKPCDWPAWAFQCGFWLGGATGDDPGTGGLRPEDLAQPQGQAGGGARTAAAAPDPASPGGGHSAATSPAFKAFLKRPVSPAPPPCSPGAGPPSARGTLAVVTFGSMALARDTLLADIVAVLRAAGYKVLVLTGWKGDSVPPGVPTPAQDPCVFCTREMPHDWLFRQVAALVVHHGGAGTTGRALSCGIPSIIVPILRWSDQTMWGMLVEALGVGVLVREPHPSRAVLAAAVARALAPPSASGRGFTGTALGDAANAVGATVRAERAGETARLLLESCLCNQVLTPAEADALHPLSEAHPGVTAALRRHGNNGMLAVQAGEPELGALTPAQRMCLRSCVPCAMLRRADPAPLRALLAQQQAQTQATLHGPQHHHRPHQQQPGGGRGLARPLFGGGEQGVLVTPPPTPSGPALLATPPLQLLHAQQQRFASPGALESSPAAASSYIDDDGDTDGDTSGGARTRASSRGGSSGSRTTVPLTRSTTSTATNLTSSRVSRRSGSPSPAVTVPPSAAPPSGGSTNSAGGSPPVESLGFRAVTGFSPGPGIRRSSRLR